MLAFVLSKEGNPLMPCSPRTARKLLEEKKAFLLKKTKKTLEIG